MDYQSFHYFFFKIYSKESWIANVEYDPSFNSNLSFHVPGDILNSLLLCELFMFFYVLILRFDKAILFSILHKSSLSVRLSNKTFGSEFLLYSEFINIVSLFIFVLI